MIPPDYTPLALSLSQPRSGRNTPQTFNAWRKYADVRRLALAPRFAHVAAQLLGVDRVRLYQVGGFR